MLTVEVESAELDTATMPVGWRAAKSRRDPFRGHLMGSLFCSLVFALCVVGALVQSADAEEFNLRPHLSPTDRNNVNVELAESWRRGHIDRGSRQRGSTFFNCRTLSVGEIRSRLRVLGNSTDVAQEIIDMNGQCGH